ncbi:MAG: hypothetical protein JKY31_07035 [Rhodobacteraceae bacterium]|nr:hypothetical protein [Paracoccaceae bacterium]
MTEYTVSIKNYIAQYLGLNAAYWILFTMLTGLLVKLEMTHIVPHTNDLSTLGPAATALSIGVHFFKTHQRSPTRSEIRRMGMIALPTLAVISLLGSIIVNKMIAWELSAMPPIAEPENLFLTIHTQIGLTLAMGWLGIWIVFPGWAQDKKQRKLF